MYQRLPDGGLLATAIVFTVFAGAVFVLLAAVCCCCCRGSKADEARPIGLEVVASPTSPRPAAVLVATAV